MSEAPLSLERLIEQHKIRLLSELPSEEWPEQHRAVFESVENLKTIKFKTYIARSKFPTGDESLREENEDRTERLVSSFEECSRQNESTSRNVCEQHVFDRLDNQLTCHQCGTRVWRSDSITRESPEPEGAPISIERQTQHRICGCPPGSQPHERRDKKDSNKFLIARIGTSVKHVKEVRCKRSTKHSQESRRKRLPTHAPDRVYGLRKTASFNKHLEAKLDNGQTVQEMIRIHPYLKPNEEALFPFAVLEAKQSRSRDDWQSIFTQTALPVYTFLSIQRGLISSTSLSSRCRFEPLVWFFMNKGGEWRVYLAYQNEHTATSSSGFEFPYTTDVALVWKGSTDNHNEALQLVLIADYMAKWAEETYRKNILDRLEILALSRSSVPGDTITCSWRRPIPAQSPVSRKKQWPRARTGERGLLKEFQDLDSNLGAVRHVGTIISRFLSVHVTTQNLKEFLGDVDEAGTKYREKFADSILNEFICGSDVTVLSEKQLCQMESSWTGASEVPSSLAQDDTKFYAKVQVSYYLSQSWHQVRELTVVAFDVDAFDQLINGLYPEDSQRSVQFPLPSNTMQVGSQLSQFKRYSARQNLLCAINRTSSSLTKYIPPPGSHIESDCQEGDNATVWILANCVYELYKRGFIEPAVPYISCSERVEKQPSNSADEPSTNQAGRLVVSGNSGVLVTARDDPESASNTRFGSNCLYLVKEFAETPSKAEVAETIRSTFESCDIYHTTRDHGSLNSWSSGTLPNVWNLNSTYGICLDWRPIVGWLNYLGSAGPSKQGSPRSSIDNGQLIFTREWVPWRDPRLDPYYFDDPQWEVSIKKRIDEEVCFWSLRARERIQQGTMVCLVCAKKVAFVPRQSSHQFKSEFDLSDVCRICKNHVAERKRLGEPETTREKQTKLSTREWLMEEVVEIQAARMLIQSRTRQLDMRQDDLEHENGQAGADSHRSPDSNTAVGPEPRALEAQQSLPTDSDKLRTSQTSTSRSPLMKGFEPSSPIYISDSDDDTYRHYNSRNNGASKRKSSNFTDEEQSEDPSSPSSFGGSPMKRKRT